MKAKRTNHKARVTEIERELLAKDNQITYLVQTIRAIDDKLFSISQCTNWESMRPRINLLIDEMTSRKVAESNRINDIVRHELIKTYTPAQLPQTKLLTKR